MKTQTVKHTPGPWKVDRHSDESIHITAPCDYPPKDGHAFVYEITELSFVNTEANARLIAAAPDLLEVCKRIVRAIEWANTTDRMTDTEKSIMLHAAIAKAEGNQ